MHHLVSKFGVSQEGEEKMKVEICMLVCAAAQCYFESRMCLVQFDSVGNKGGMTPAITCRQGGVHI